MSWSPNEGDTNVETGSRRKKSNKDGGEGGGATFTTVFDITFLKSLPGILLSIQVVCSFLGSVLAGSWGGSYSGGHVFFIIIDVTVFLCALFLLISRLVRLDDLMRRNVDWNIVLCFYSGPTALLLLIASCVMVEAAKAVSALKAAGVFGLFAWNALLCSFLLHGKPVYDVWKNKMPTATATLTPGPPTTSAGGEGSSDDFSSDEEPAADDCTETTGVTLTQATLRPPSGHVASDVKVSDSSLYPVDIAGSNRGSGGRPGSSYSTTAANWGLQ